MKIKYSLGRILGRVAQYAVPVKLVPSGLKERFLENVRLELERRNFSAELYKDFSGRGIHGKLDIFPLVLVNVYIPYSSPQVEACIFFERDLHRDEAVKTNPLFSAKMNRRYYDLSVNPVELARELGADALILGAAQHTTARRQEIEDCLRKQ